MSFGAVVIILIVLLLGSYILITRNGAIKREKDVESAGLAVTTEKARRVSLFLNLVDSVESYNEHESNIYSEITKVRSQVNDGNLESARGQLNLLVENNPELKSQGNYNSLMEEMSITENRVANNITGYNNRIKEYEYYCESQPNKMILDISNYRIIDFTPMKEETMASGNYHNLFKGDK